MCWRQNLAYQIGYALDYIQQTRFCHQEIMSFGGFEKLPNFAIKTTKKYRKGKNANSKNTKHCCKFALDRYMMIASDIFTRK